eukprot:1081892-Amphidinium_carterae.1
MYPLVEHFITCGCFLPHPYNVVMMFTFILPHYTMVPIKQRKTALMVKNENLKSGHAGNKTSKGMIYVTHIPHFYLTLATSTNTSTLYPHA